MNSRLRKIRASAHPAISIREMAEKLGVSHATYHNYERDAGFKARFLPMATARKIAAILADHGINPDEVLALAGIGIDERTTPSLSAGEEKVLDLWRRLTPTQRRLTQAMMEELVGGDGVAPGTVHSPALGFRPEEAHR